MQMLMQTCKTFADLPLQTEHRLDYRQKLSFQIQRRPYIRPEWRWVLVRWLHH